ncbi:glycosyltransferase family 4 protein [Leifsonia sp. NPDC058292]|uniref:glycosyltransferase family 4 protein n=1 Tax=Leifsonia sp. NPDC058292 TaxID=3346428 RepID=UPI0036DB79BD
MRIAIVYDCLYPLNTGGGERVYRRMAELLVDRGHSVDYLTRDQWGDADAPAAPFTVVPVWSGEIYDAEGGRRAAAAAGFALAVFRELRRRRGEYDLVIVSALPVLNVFAARAATIGTRTRLLSDWLEVWTWRKWREYSGALVGTIASVLQWFALRLTAGATVNSSFTRDRVRRYRRRLRPIVLGLLDLAGEPRRPSAVASRPGLVLFAGRHIPDKQLTALPAAIAVAHDADPAVRAVVVGSGPETEALRRAVAEHGVGELFDIRGRVDDDELERLFAEAAVLVNPSRREGFGLVVAEAAAVGTPSVVVAGDDNAAVDLIVEGVNGFVAADAGPQALGGAIARAVAGGQQLRTSTAEWFVSASRSQNLSRSVDEILERYGSSAR